MAAARSPGGTAVPSSLGPLTQTRRLLRLRTPLGADALFAENAEIWEGIGPCDGPALDGGDDALGLGPARAGLRLVVHALAGDARIDLGTLVGQPALVELLCQDSATDRRPWHGHIVAAALVGSDGGLARYRLVVEPWLAVLAHTVDAWCFQDRSVPQILDELFGGYQRAGRDRGHDPGRLAPAWRWDLADARAYPKRSLCVQYHESDLDFALRLMREEGLVCWWEHDGDADSPGLGRHTLVIADHNGAFVPNPQPTVRFTASDHTLGEDSLTRWTDIARLTSARVALRSRDHRSLDDRPVEAPVGAASTADPGAPAAPLPACAIVDVPGAYAYADRAQGERLAARQAEALAAVRSRALARGPWRRAQAGTTFTLADHPRHDGRDAARDTFVVLSAQHRARNDIAADERARLGGGTSAPGRSPGPAGRAAGTTARDDDAPLHEAALLMQPLAVPVRMGRQDPSPHGVAADGDFGVFNRVDDRTRVATASAAPPSLFDRHAVASLAQPEVRLAPRPTVRGTQTALVVGDGHAAGGADPHTDRDGRVRVQFHWQRGSRASHRLDHPQDGPDDNAPASAASGPWVRVGQSLAGANFGAVFTPRVGQEVLVDFLGGDIDRPVIVGAVYNGRGAPDAQGNRIAAGAAGARGSAPAWFAGSRRAEPPGGHHEGPREGGHADDPEGHQHPAVLLGHRSQELGHGAPGHGGASQLVFDDSAAGHRIELSTTPGPGATTPGSGTQATRLQLGALRHQQGNQRLAPRGHGLELATDDHGALRAGAGLLLSAHAQPPSTQGGGQQLDTRAAQQVLQAARDLAHTLADSAQAHHARLGGESPVAGAAPAQGMDRNQGQQLPAEHGLQALAESLAATGSGPGADAPSEAGVVAGADQNAPAPTAGGLGSVPAWGRPDLVLAAPAGIGLFTPAAALLAAGTHLTLGAGQDLLAVAQGHHASVAKDGVVLYTHGTPGRAADPARSEAETGIALHAASGSVHASSNTGATRLTARDAVEVTSTQAGVLVASPQQIRLSAAGAALEIGAGGIMVKAPGAVKFKASIKVLTGPASATTSGLSLPTAPEVYIDPQGPFSVRFAANGADDLLADAGFVDLPYAVYAMDGSVLMHGFVGKDGRLPRISTEKYEKVILQLGNPTVAELTKFPISNSLDMERTTEHPSNLENPRTNAPAFDKEADKNLQSHSNRYLEDIQSTTTFEHVKFLEESVITDILGLLRS